MSIKQGYVESQIKRLLELVDKKDEEIFNLKTQNETLQKENLQLQQELGAVIDNQSGKDGLPQQPKHKSDTF